MFCIPVGSFDDIKRQKRYPFCSRNNWASKAYCQRNGIRVQGKSETKKDRNEWYNYDYVSVPCNTVLHNINSIYHTGSTGTWIVYSYCIHKPLQRTGRILSEYGGRHGILWCDLYLCPKSSNFPESFAWKGSVSSH